MEIRVQGPRQEPVPFVVTMRTPGNDFELAAGLCLTEGIVTTADEIDTIAYCLGGEGEQLYNVVTVRLRRAARRRRARAAATSRTRRAASAARPRSTRSRCGAGPSAPGPTVAASDVSRAPGAARASTSACSARPVACTRPRVSRPTARCSPCAKTSAGTTRSTSSSATRCSRASCRSPTRSCSCRVACRSSSCRRPRSRASPCCARCRRRRAWRSRRPSASARRVVGFVARRPLQRLHAPRTHRPGRLMARRTAGAISSRASAGCGASLWVGWKPNGIGEQKPRHYGAIVRTVVGQPAQPAVGVAHPPQGSVRRVRARRRRLPRLDDQRRAPLHDAPRPPEGEHRARDRRRPAWPTSAALASTTGRELRELGRLAHPMVRRKGERGIHPRVVGRPRSTSIAGRIRATTPDRVGIYLTARGITNEVYYVAQKAARFLGTNNVDNAARVLSRPVDGSR